MPAQLGTWDLTERMCEGFERVRLTRDYLLTPAYVIRHPGFNATHLRKVSGDARIIDKPHADADQLVQRLTRERAGSRVWTVLPVAVDASEAESVNGYARIYTDGAGHFVAVPDAWCTVLDDPPRLVESEIRDPADDATSGAAWLTDGARIAVKRLASMPAGWLAVLRAIGAQTGTQGPALAVSATPVPAAPEPKPADRGEPPKGKRWPVTSAESQTYIDTGKLPSAKADPKPADGPREIRSGAQLEREIQRIPAAEPRKPRKAATMRAGKRGKPEPATT